MKGLRIAVTGIGINTSLGQGLDAHIMAWQKGEQALSPLTTYTPEKKKPFIGGEITQLDKLPLPQPKLKKLIGRKDHLAVATAFQALQGIDLAGFDPYKLGVFVGSCSTQLEDFHPYFTEVLQCIDSSEDKNRTFNSSRFGSKALQSINPISAVKVLMNGALAHIAQSFQLKGPNANFLDLELSGFMALQQACESLHDKTTDLCLVGAMTTPLDLFQLTDPLTHYDLLSGEDPQDLLKEFRPGDPQSSGRLPGEGAIFLILEREEEARSRGSKIHTVITHLNSSALGQSLKPLRTKSAAAEECFRGLDLSPQKVVCNFNGSPRFDHALAESLHSLISSDQKIHIAAPLWQTGDLGEASSLYNLVWSLHMTQDKNDERKTYSPTLSFKPHGPSTNQRSFAQVLTMSRYGAAGLIIHGDGI